MPTVDADYYALLRVAPSADAATIRTAWAAEQRLWGVRQNAPDLSTRHAAERHVQLLGEVKDLLLDPVRRAQYDLERARSVASRAGTLPVQGGSPLTAAAPGRGTPAAASPGRGTPAAAARVAGGRGRGVGTNGTQTGLARAGGDDARQSDRGPQRPPGYLARHGDVLKPLVFGLAGGLITLSQVFHWDVSSIAAVVSWMRALAGSLHG
ncbi:MAG TPA: hypothetical protein VKV73_05580 [Chloroflexota bacterium]|nr:hypothetical protein [Chloroflexota bacterium]